MEKRFQDDPELKKLLQGFVHELPERGCEINRAAQNGEWNKVTQLLHTLKGTAACYEVRLVSQCAAELERLTAANVSNARILPLIEDLQRLIESLSEQY